MQTVGDSPEARLDALMARDPNVLALAAEARDRLARIRQALGSKAVVRLSAVDGQLCPGLTELITIFEGLPVGGACTKLELWHYAHQRASSRPPRPGK